MTRRKGLFARLRRSLRWILRIVLVALVIDLVYVASIWPDWRQIARGPIPKSSFMRTYLDRQPERQWPPLQWQPVALDTLPRHLLRAAIIAEDSRFYDHSGFDLIAIKEALDYNLEQGRFVFGASTITQQTVKNLYLSPSRDPLRKWHEIFLTWGIENNLRKSRILELYLNIAEFGRGIYGVQAAARHYYGIDAAKLSLQQSAELAATLPSPVKSNPAAHGEAFERRLDRILRLLNREQFGQAEPVVEQLSEEGVDREAVAPIPESDDRGVAASSPAETRL
ncbi:MAG: monofunctional biosynthetic peptidoglycan transglycosylase [Gammaproteobacteria bacterium]|nr:monofunctional biosynthetic peptidoglycan transglycosylase [Gammaproteobacteria bacterium]